MEALIRFYFPSLNVEEMEMKELLTHYEEAIFMLDLEVKKTAEAIAKALEGEQ